MRAAAHHEEALARRVQKSIRSGLRQVGFEIAATAEAAPGTMRR